MIPVDEMLPIEDALRTLMQEFGIERTRQCLYNWMSKGVKRHEEIIKLQYEEFFGRRYTTRHWIAEFLDETGIE